MSYYRLPDIYKVPLEPNEQHFLWPYGTTKVYDPSHGQRIFLIKREKYFYDTQAKCEQLLVNTQEAAG